MPIQFRRRIRLLPGVWLNLSKSGVSTSIGGKGVTVNLGKNGRRTTVSLPGTGLSYTQRSSSPQRRGEQAQQPSPPGNPTARRVAIALWVVLILCLIIVMH